MTTITASRVFMIMASALLLLASVGSLTAPAEAATPIGDAVEGFEGLGPVEDSPSVEETLEEETDIDAGHLEMYEMSCFGDRYTYYRSRKYGHSTNPYQTLWAGSTTQAGCPSNDVRRAYLQVYRRSASSTGSYGYVAGRSCRGNGDQGGCTAEYYEFKTCTPYVRYCHDYRSRHYIRNSSGRITYGVYTRTYNV